MDEVERELIGNTDAQIWAKAFVKMVGENPSIPTDEGTMLAWFSTAIMSGYDEGVKKEQAKDIVERLNEVIYQAAGAATAVCMEDHPDYIFPAERVRERVSLVCKEFGIPPREGN